MKYEFMQRNATEFSIERMSRVFNVSRSGYYRFINKEPSSRRLEDERLLLKIKAIHNSRQTYGSPRICAELQDQEENCSRKHVARIMRKFGVMAKMKKRFKVTTRQNPDKLAAPNLLRQDFSANKPNQRWVADFTYVATKEGWLYVATVLDLFSRRIVGFSMGDRMTTDLVIYALQQALIHRKPTNVLHHSERGCQYTSDRFQQFLKKHDVTVSMSGSGNCYDNAAMGKLLSYA
jgi:putative transposase